MNINLNQLRLAFEQLPTKPEMGDRMTVLVANVPKVVEARSTKPEKDTRVKLNFVAVRYATSSINYWAEWELEL